MPKFEVEFRDGRKVVKDTNTADDAKTKARTDRRKDVAADAPASADELMVRRVTQLEDKPKSSRSGRNGEGDDNG